MTSTDDQHVKFGESINPIKIDAKEVDPNSQYTSEKDVEVASLAVDDFNISKKQVCIPSAT